MDKKHYIFIYEFRNSEYLDYLPQEFDNQILEHVAMILALHKSSDENMPLSNTIVFGSTDSLKNISDTFNIWKRKYTDYVLARISPLKNMDSGYKPKANYDVCLEKREILKKHIKHYKTINQEDLIKKLQDW